MSELVGNCLVAQSGGPTSVINSSIAGAVNEALNYECIEEIYGGLNGVLGILNEDLIDLAWESQQAVRGLRHTPGSALGTCRYKLKKTNDFHRILQVFQAHNIRFFFYAGGNDSQGTAERISTMARETGYEMRVIGIPKTIDNDIVATDHCPGYGSVIKHISTVVREMACDHESMGQGDLVSILEVMGRNAGWIAAGASLAQRRDKPNDPPHLIYLPEVAFSTEKFLADVRRVLSRERYCMIVVGEGLVDEAGNYVHTSSSSSDAFGHAQLGGAGEYLRELAESLLGVKARTAKLGISQRAAASHASQTDSDEAYLVGQAAVRAAMSGITDKMITLVRSESDNYACTTGLANLSEVADAVKPLPVDWINEDGTSMSYQFVKYALPLIQGEVEVPEENGLPDFVRLGKTRIFRLLEPHQPD